MIIKRSVGLIITSFVFSILVLMSPHAQGLSVVYCEEDTIQCRVQNCETDNTVARWDQTGNEKDCSVYEEKARNHSRFLYSEGTAMAIAVGCSLVFFLSGVLIGRRTLIKNKAKKKK